MKKIVLSGIVAIGLAVVFSGCQSAISGASKPTPFMVSNINTSFNPSQQQKVLNYTIDSVYSKYKFSVNYKSKNKVNKAQSKYNGTDTISFQGLNAIYEQTFKIDSNNNIIREDWSHKDGYGRNPKPNMSTLNNDAYCMLCDDWGFNKYIDKFQEKLKIAYLSNINNPSIISDIAQHKRRVEEIKAEKIKEKNELNELLPKKETFIPKSSKNLEVSAIFKTIENKYFAYTTDGKNCIPLGLNVVRTKKELSADDRYLSLNILRKTNDFVELSGRTTSGLIVKPVFFKDLASCTGYNYNR